MAIIKTLRLQAFLLLALLGAVQSYGPPPAPTFVASISKATPSHVPKVDGDKCTDHDEIFLTCIKSSTPWQTPHLAFKKDDKVGSWVDVSSMTSKKNITKTLPTDASSYGTYTCLAGLGSTGGLTTKADDKVSMECTGCASNDVCTGNAAFGKSSHCKDGKCACMYGGDLGSCKVCKEDTNEGCTDKDKPRCDSGKSCEECEKDSNKGCKGTTPICLNEINNMKCWACTQSETARKACKKGTYCQKNGSCTADKPSGGDKSSAGTVTSTACLVIASVVVALMN